MEITFTYSDEVDLGNVNALYMVVFGRYDDDETAYIQGEGDDWGAIKQLQGEIQEACDQGHIAGNFNILARKHMDGPWVSSKSATPAANAEYFKIRVLGSDGMDISDKLAQHVAVDAWSPGMGPGNRAQPGQAIGTFDGLTKSETTVALAQIIDNCREWGPTDDEAEALYKLIDPILGRKRGALSMPDGQLVMVERIEQETPVEDAVAPAGKTVILQADNVVNPIPEVGEHFDAVNDKWDMGGLECRVTEVR